MTFLRRCYWPGLAALLAAAVWLAFGRAVHFEFAPIDDFALIVYNLAIRHPSFVSVHWIFTHFDPELYIPLTYLSFLGEYAAWGLSPFHFHLDSLILHGLNALLVAAVVGKLSSWRWVGASAALLFAIHPLQTEAVVWIAARKDVLSTFLSLLTVLCVFRFTENGKVRWLWVGLVTFLLALLSKVSVAALPLLLIVLMRMHDAPWKISGRRVAPFVLASIVFAVIAVVGKAGVFSAFDPLRHLVLASYGVAAVIGHMFVPVYLSPFYAVPALSIDTVLVALIPPVLLIVAWMTRSRFPLAALGIVWMIALLALPALNVQTDLNAAGATFAADRYGYLPLVGMLFVLVAIVQSLSTQMARRVGALVFAALASSAVVASRAQTMRWSSAPTLYQYALDVHPAATDARLGVVRILRAQERLEDAFAVLLTGLRYTDTKDLHLEAGSIYAASGRVEEAKEQFTIARDRDPDAPEPYFALGELAAYAKDDSGALALYNEAIQREPEYGKAIVRKAAIVRRMGDDAGAEALLLGILVFDPANIDALIALADFRIAHGDTAGALPLVETAEFLYPNAPDVQRLRFLLSSGG